MKTKYEVHRILFIDAELPIASTKPSFQWNLTMVSCCLHRTVTWNIWTTTGKQITRYLVPGKKSFKYMQLAIPHASHANLNHGIYTREALGAEAGIILRCK